MKLSHPEKFNIDLAEKVLGHIKLNPGDYNQSCHDRCLIGWAGRLDARQRGVTGWRLAFADFQGGRALGLNHDEDKHIFLMLFPFWAKARLRNFIRQAQSYRAEQERAIDAQARAQVHAVYALVKERKGWRSAASLSKTPVTQEGLTTNA